MIRGIYLFFMISVLLYSSDFYYQNNQKIYLKKISNTFRSLQHTDTYIDENNQTLGVGSEIVIEVDEKLFNRDTFIEKYAIEEMTKIANRFYRCKLKDRSKIFETAAKIYQEKSIKSAHPNFIRQKYLR